MYQNVAYIILAFLTKGGPSKALPTPFMQLLPGEEFIHKIWPHENLGFLLDHDLPYLHPPPLILSINVCN
jgi:hypothetical protein